MKAVNFSSEEGLPLLHSSQVAVSSRSVFVADSEKDNVVGYVQNQQEGKWSRAVGYLSLLGASLNFSLVSFVLRAAQTVFHIPTTTVMFTIFSCDLIMGILFVIFTSNLKLLNGLKRRDLLLLGARGFFGVLSTIAIYAAMKLAPVGDVTAAFNICPATTLVFAALFLGEPIYKADVIALVLSLLGVYLITRPASSDSDSFQHAMAPVTGTIYGLLSGIFVGAAMIPVRKMGRNTHFIFPALSLFTFATVYSSLAGGIPSFSEFTSYGFGTVALLTASIANFLAQILLNIGLQRCPAGPAILIRNIETPLNYCTGILFLHEIPTSLRVFAAFLIICSTVIIGVRNALRS